MDKFEGHITFEAPSLQSLVDVQTYIHSHKGAKFSYINNDPILGKGPYAYLTLYGAEPISLGHILDTISDNFKHPEAKVLRVKVEQILYDRIIERALNKLPS